MTTPPRPAHVPALLALLLAGALAWAPVTALAWAPATAGTRGPSSGASPAPAPEGEAGLAARWPLLADGPGRIKHGAAGERGWQLPRRGVLIALPTPVLGPGAPAPEGDRGPPDLAMLGVRQVGGG